MASPFNIFRKHQKTMLVVAGVAAMFVFVVGDPLLSLISGGRGRGSQVNSVVATWDGRQITRSELEQTKQVREVCRSFLDVAMRLGFQATGQFPRVPVVIQTSANEQVLDSTVLNTLLLADRANQAGFVVSDETINIYLGQLTQNSVTTDQLDALMRQGFGRTGVNQATLFDTLRTEMLAQEYARNYQLTGMSLLPATRWQRWKNLNDRIELQVMPVAVADFLDQVEEPTDQQVTEFYEKYRDTIKSPDIIGSVTMDSPTPGFKAPRKVVLQSLEADFEEFVALVAEEITDEEIAQYYEENKEDYKRVQLTSDDEQPAGDEVTETTIPDASEGSEKSSENSTDDQTPTTTEDTATDDADTSSADSTDPSSTDADTDAAPNNAASTSARQSAFRLMAYQKEQPPAPQPDAVQPAPNGAESNDTESTPPESAEEPSEEQPEYESLEEVSDQIRRRLAEQRAAQRIEKTLAEPLRMMRLYSETYSAQTAREKIAADNNTNDEPAKQPPSLEKLAEGTALKYAQAGPLSFFELRETEIGQSNSDEDRAELAVAAFRLLPLYRPRIAFDVRTGNRYIAWKTADTPDHVVPLDDIRDEVVRAWKMAKARELAEQEANKLAGEAQRIGGPLNEVFANDENLQVTDTDMFSRETLGSVSQTGQMTLRLSEVHGVDAAGLAFMNEAFKLQQGDIGAALNHPQTIAYVLRLVQHEKPLTELHEEFMRSVYPGDSLSNMLYTGVTQQSMGNIGQKLIEQVRRELNFQRQDLPEEPSSENAPEETAQ